MKDSLSRKCVNPSKLVELLTISNCPKQERKSVVRASIHPHIAKHGLDSI